MYTEDEKEEQKRLADERYSEIPPSWRAINLKNCLVAGGFGSLIVTLVFGGFIFLTDEINKNEVIAQLRDDLEKTLSVARAEKNTKIRALDLKNKILERRIRNLNEDIVAERINSCAWLKKNSASGNSIAQLPSHLNEKLLCDLDVGERGYTVPWAMVVNSSGQCFLKRSYTAKKWPGGTIQMLVEHRKDGYHVHVPPGEKFSRSGWVDTADKTDVIPIQVIHSVYTYIED